MDEAHPPEGNEHRRAKELATDALSSLERTGRRIYVSAELPVYYPGERMFAPDVLAVSDVDNHPRKHWTVSHEGKGLESCVLGLELSLEQDRLRFHFGPASLPQSHELIERLERAVTEQTQKRNEEARALQEALEQAEAQLAEEAKLRAEAEKRAAREQERADQEKEQRVGAEERLVEALAELERLRRGQREPT